MLSQKLYPDVILVLHVGEYTSGERVTPARFQSENAPSEIRPIFPRSWHADYHFSIHLGDLTKNSPCNNSAGLSHVVSVSYRRLMPGKDIGSAGPNQHSRSTRKMP